MGMTLSIDELLDELIMGCYLKSSMLTLIFRLVM